MTARRLLALGAGTAVLGTAAVPALAATRSVHVADDYFVRPTGRPTVKVRRSTTVVWHFHGSRPHNVTVVRGPLKFASKTLSGGTYSRRLTRRGTYSIVCTLHSGMAMRLRVI